MVSKHSVICKASEKQEAVCQMGQCMMQESGFMVSTKMGMGNAKCRMLESGFIAMQKGVKAI